MKVYKEISVTDFENDSWCCDDFWEKIHEQNLESQLDDYFEEMYPDGIEETELNDVLRFDGDELLKDLGYVEEEEDGEE